MHIVAAAAALLAAPAILASAAPQTGPSAAHAEPGASTGEHRFRTADGVELWYRVAGVDRGLPVLFLHGGPGEGSQAMQALGGPALERRVRMVYLDQRGSGRSGRPKESKSYSWALLENDVEAVRRELGVDRLVLLAHSAGTPIALNYAANHPDRVAGLILTGAVPDFPAAIDSLCARMESVRPTHYPKAVAAAGPGQRCNPFAAFEGEEAQRFFDENMFPNRMVRERVNWLDHIPGLANTGEVGNALFEQGLTAYRFDRPERITMPLLMIAGGRDFQTPLPPQKVLATKVEDGKLILYRDAGHFMFADEPERFARDVAQFVDKVTR